MAMQALRDGASGGILKFFLLGILCLAAGGLVFTDVGGFFRGGVSGNDVVKIGKDTVTINTFDRVARRSLAQLGISTEQAYKMGYLNQILTAEINRRSLMHAADDNNIRVGRDYVVEQIQDILGPAMASGLSPEEALQSLLRSQGITESELSTTILSERTLSLFGDGMKAGALYTPKAHAKTLYAFDNETRDIRYIEFPHADFKDIQEPNDEQLTVLYEKTKEQFASPERREIKVATIKTDKLSETLTIEEDELRTTYEDNIEVYTTPASRSAAQAIFQSKDDAKKAAEKLTAANFDKAAKEAKADVIPAKPFTEENILDEIKEPLFSAEKTGIIGPIETPLGWTVLNITEIKEENVKSFDSVKKEIREDLVQDLLIDEIYKLVDEVDEFFATGGTLDDAKEQFDISIETFEGITRYGQDAEQKAPLAPAFGPDAQTILQSAYELDEGTTGPAFELSDARFVVVNTAAVAPKTYASFDDVKEQIKQQWMNDERELSNRAALIAIQKTNSEASIEGIAKGTGKSFKTISDIKRDDEESPLSEMARNAIFEAKKAEHFIIETKNGVALAEVTNIDKANNPDEKQLEEIQAQIQQSMQNEMLALYMNKLLEKNPAKVNYRLLDQIYGEQPETE